MLQTYEAIYDGKQFQWLNDIPPQPEKEIRVVLLMDVEKTVVNSKPNIHEVLQKAWGCLGTGKNLDEIDQEINEMRQEWEREWN